MNNVSIQIRKNRIWSLYAYPQLLASKFKHLLVLGLILSAFTAQAQITTRAQVNVLNIDGKEMSFVQASDMQIWFKEVNGKQFMWIYYKSTKTADKGEILNKTVTTEDGLLKTDFYWTFDTGCKSELYFNGDNQRGILIFEYEGIVFMLTFTIIK